MTDVARNELSVSATSYGPALDWYLGPEGARKVTLDVQGNPVYLQVSRSSHPGDYPPPAGSEILIRTGFTSKVFASPFFQLRLRAKAGAATVSISAT